MPELKQRHLLVWYATHEGQTRKIAEYICQQAQGYVVEWCLLNETPSRPLEQYDRVLVAASIRYGHFPAVLRRQVSVHHESLTRAQAAFIGVCLTARKPGKDTAATNPYLRKWLRASQWQPSVCAVFAGALRYSRYNTWQRSIIQLIMWMTGGSRDTSQDIEYTNWASVDEFATAFFTRK